MDALDLLVEELVSAKEPVYLKTVPQSGKTNCPYASEGTLYYFREGRELPLARVLKLSLLGIKPNTTHSLSGIEARVDRERRVNGYEGAIVIKAMIAQEEANIVVYPSAPVEKNF